MASQMIPDVTSKLRGIGTLHDSTVNKSTTYTESEHHALGLAGLGPNVTEPAGVHLRQSLEQLGHRATDLDRYIYLVGYARQ